METPTAAEIRVKMPSIDWEALDVPDDPALDELLLDATDQIGMVTGWVLANVPPTYERTMVRAHGLMAAWLASRQSIDVVETAGDWDLIASMSAGSYSETRRGSPDALWALTLVNPWPPLAGLLWNLMLPTFPPPGDPAVAARLDYWTEVAAAGKGEHAPAWETTEVDWSGTGYAPSPGTAGGESWDWAGGRYQMGFRSVLVDRARTVTQEDGGIEVRGKTVFVEVRGDWFRCRLELPRSPENLDAATSRRNVVKAPTLMYDTVDEERQPVALHPEQRLEISSKQLGEAVWDVTAAPEPFRKKRRVIGFQTTVRRVEDAQVADAAVE